MFEQFGSFGVLSTKATLTPEFCQEMEALGYGTVWIVGNPGGDLQQVSDILAATSTLQVATAIVNIWADDAEPIAAAFHRIQGEHPGRFWLGVGVGHSEAVGDRYAKPYQSMVDYLDRLDATGVPAASRILAALGPKMLRLSADRAAGAHPYLVTPEYTARARETLGPDALLAPEHKVVLDPNPVSARAIGRPVVAYPYLGFKNYTNNLRSLGYTDEDLAGEGSDRLVDDLVAHGDAATVAARLRQHLDNGANHVPIHLLPEDGTDLRPGYAALASELF